MVTKTLVRVTKWSGWRWRYLSVCDAAAEMSTTLSEFINLFACLDMKTSQPEVHDFQPAVSVVGENGTKSIAVLERLPRICQELWVLVFSSVSYCPHPGDDCGEPLEMGQVFLAQEVHHEELGCSSSLRQWKPY